MAVWPVPAPSDRVGLPLPQRFPLPCTPCSEKETQAGRVPFPFPCVAEPGVSNAIWVYPWCLNLMLQFGDTPLLSSVCL